MRLTTKIGTALAAAVAIVSFALPASASVHHGHSTFANAPAVTNLINRPDSGNFSADPWANDSISRHTSTTQTGFDTYVVTINDQGSFITIPGNTSPNDGSVTETASNIFGAKATLAGSDTFTVVATRAPDYSAINGKTFTGSNPATSMWPYLIFPAGSIVSVTQGPWSWTYQLKCPQQWAPQLMTQASTGTTGNVLGCV